MIGDHMKHLGTHWERSPSANPAEPAAQTNAAEVVRCLPPQREKVFGLTGVPPAADTRSGPPGELDIRLTIHLFQKQMAMIGAADGRSFGDCEEFLRQFRQGFAPRDKTEELLVGQLAMLHGRLAQLTYLCCRSPDASHAMELHAAADRVANSFRLHLQTFVNHRRPVPDIAIQQIIQQGTKIENELRTPHAPSLPVVQTRVTDSEDKSPQAPALAREHRPQDPLGQAAQLDERVQDR
jgi:hypothetical protein